MLRRAIGVLLLVIASTFGLCHAEMVVPGIDITSPTDGTVLLDHVVEVTGTSSEPVETWLQSTQADLAGGLMDSVCLTPSGDLLINGTYDDFDDEELDLSRWSVESWAGMLTYEEGGQLHMGGTALTGMMVDYMYTTVASSRTGGFTMVSVNLTSFAGSGTGCCAELRVGTTANHVSITILNEGGDLWARAVIEKDGFSDGEIVEITTPAPHNLRAYQDQGFWVLCLDGNVVFSSAQASVDTGLLHLSVAPRAVSDTVDACWDDVMFYPASGNYTSEVHDTGAPASTVKYARWNATTPPGTSLEVSARTAENQDMSDAGPWVVLWNNVYVGPADRYLQYRVRFNDPLRAQSPVLHDVSFVLQFPLAKVEVSLDQTNWTLAEGTTQWRAPLDVPENRSVIWARATDTRGTAAVASVTVDVDTTPPWGTVVINGGRQITMNPTVQLNLISWDNYEVADMRIGETPDLAAVPWTPLSAFLYWNLSSGDGTKTVYAMFRDVHGLTSEVVSGSIVLDTEPPVGTILIDGGVGYVRSSSVELSLTATDTSGVVDMRIWNDDDEEVAVSRPFTTSMYWELSPGQGTKRVNAMLRDRAFHDSAVISASVVVDLDPPNLDIVLDEGAPYTNDTRLAVLLYATDDHGVADMQLSEDPSFAVAEWVPFEQACELGISSTEGPRTVHARVRDLAGNVGRANATIVLDLTAPDSAVVPLPAEVDSEDFTVSWSATDALSGVRSYDVQFRKADKPWQDWLVGTELVNATFKGAYNQTYWFRVRACDLAGNTGSFSTPGSGPVLVRPAPAAGGDPRVAILRPKDRSLVRGTVLLEGNASHGDSKARIVAVFVQVDDGNWGMATGTNNWTHTLDTRGLDDGRHTLRARSYDGARNSTVATVTIDVQNEGNGREGAGPVIAVAIIVLLAAAAVVAIVVLRRARGKGSDRPREQ
jgi:hypothetical protein